MQTHPAIQLSSWPFQSPAANPFKIPDKPLCIHHIPVADEGLPPGMSFPSEGWLRNHPQSQSVCRLHHPRLNHPGEGSIRLWPAHAQYHLLFSVSLSGPICLFRACFCI
ncbi:hypothetical protein Vretimale_1103 [Volvox reticuliferus]|uniref:Uncharacterized protein n=1 Tax=Volvox reticuliferus TaxID=1737510 RepID=A0A8J4D446_9CHLO|nr:hypothetical protein Vretimale_1103 [Volvox reticuliferus]